MWLFLVSLALRMHFYEIKESGKGILGPHFEPLRELYLKRSVDLGLYPYSIFHYLVFDKVLSRPQKTKFSNRISIEIMIHGYRLFLYTDKRFPDLDIVGWLLYENLVVPEIRNKNRLASDLLALIQKHQK